MVESWAEDRLDVLVVGDLLAAFLVRELHLVRTSQEALMHKISMIPDLLKVR